MDISVLPHLQAMCNATATVLLLMGFRFIRNGNRLAHKKCMASAFMVSLLFMVFYLVYHHYAGTFRFGGQGGIRMVYFLILFTHTVLAAVLPILVIKTLYHALKEQFERHRGIARWTLPIWLFVSVSGVVIYVMLYHLYPPYSG